MTKAQYSSVEMIERLVGFPTVSADSNLDLIHFARDYLAGHGIAIRLTHSADGRKANLFATIGPEIAGGVVLSGHTDVVPVGGQHWDTDPFVATVKDGRIHGRGACDMKGFLGVALAAAPRFAAADLKAPVHYALSYDEEVGCLGVRGLIADLAASGISAAGCIVGEPTRMQVVVANKGKRSYRCTVHGREAHSALAPLGVNAVEYAAKLVVYIRHVADRLAATEPREHGFEVPFTTLQTGTIRGGTALNIVPRECVFDFEMRYLPGADPDAIEREIRDYAERVLLAEMRRVAPEAAIAIERRSEVPGLAAGENEALARLAQGLARRAGFGRVGYAAEAGLFQAIGIPAIICGPGSIEQAHKPNEWVAAAELAECEAFMDRLRDELAKD